MAIVALLVCAGSLAAAVVPVAADARSPAAAVAAATGLPSIRPVFVIVLENENYGRTFGAPTPGSSLTSQLPAQGALLQSYFATAHDRAADDVGLISGQPPNVQNQPDCPEFDNFVRPGTLPNGVEPAAGASTLPASPTSARS